ncbi:PilZ domain-containing protein [Colwellia sp. Arc7-635]|uniref:PilZ domain-containing protein n=1 Tax=Colwellia sp. Arc7-635 TaxID=2497879 RepID=UPI000F84EE13|nr:PilZ domain-containing protein [Colwellia sp. Arc7-635]AZQ85255.1 PilZ domain-containing protein [Colwellia sp. Arc7-635]
MKNRRQFTRVLFSMTAKLTVDDSQFDVKIHDISLNGALLYFDCGEAILTRKIGLLSFQLDSSDAEIVMNIAIVHQEENEIGVQCNAIDITSVSLLRRLIELNLGDDEQLHKELSQLTRPEN